MFTGIVVDTGRVRGTRDRRGILEVEIAAPRVARDLDPGDSVAVNGTCLTATKVARKRFTVQVVPETVARTTLGSLERDAPVNLELAARPSDRIGGHIVQGHVDGTARAIRIETDEDAKRIWFGAGEDLLHYMVDKGSVTIDGVSLTIVEVGRTSFQVALIPHTLAVTTLGRLEVGDAVNVEVDLVAKYVERLVEKR
jgi:riboflavin synthase